MSRIANRPTCWRAEDTAPVLVLLCLQCLGPAECSVWRGVAPCSFSRVWCVVTGGHNNIDRDTHYTLHNTGPGNTDHQDRRGQQQVTGDL